jgi:hypothetical protein
MEHAEDLIKKLKRKRHYMARRAYYGHKNTHLLLVKKEWGKHEYRVAFSDKKNNFLDFTAINKRSNTKKTYM